MSGQRIEEILFLVAEALRLPVLVAALLALGLVMIEGGAFAVELTRRRRRDFSRLERALDDARAALDREDRPVAVGVLRHVAWSRAMHTTIVALVTQDYGRPGGVERMAKRLADFDYASLRRLERTRLLVRAGPALGLMGTLIPLSPALAALAAGDVQRLSGNLRVAFSVTVVGILLGALAFGISLVRDRLYGQDLSDLEYVVARLQGAEHDDRPASARAAPAPAEHREPLDPTIGSR